MEFLAFLSNFIPPRPPYLPPRCPRGRVIGDPWLKALQCFHCNRAIRPFNACVTSHLGLSIPSDRIN